MMQESDPQELKNVADISECYKEELEALQSDGYFGVSKQDVESNTLQKGSKEEATQSLYLSLLEKYDNLQMQLTEIFSVFNVNGLSELNEKCLDLLKHFTDLEAKVSDLQSEIASKQQEYSKQEQLYSNKLKEDQVVQKRLEETISSLENVLEKKREEIASLKVEHKAAEKASKHFCKMRLVEYQAANEKLDSVIRMKEEDIRNLTRRLKVFKRELYMSEKQLNNEKDKFKKQQKEMFHVKCVVSKREVICQNVKSNNAELEMRIANLVHWNMELMELCNDTKRKYEPLMEINKEIRNEIQVKNAELFSIIEIFNKKSTEEEQMKQAMEKSIKEVNTLNEKCRELQRQNKTLLGENVELSAVFQEQTQKFQENEAALQQQLCYKDELFLQLEIQKSDLSAEVKNLQQILESLRDENTSLKLGTNSLLAEINNLKHEMDH